MVLNQIYSFSLSEKSKNWNKNVFKGQPITEKINPNGPTDKEKRSLLNPYFDDITRTEIEAIEGQTVIIPCTIRNLSKEKVVSWIRKKDLHILTSGPHTFSSDFRFEAVHADNNGDFWGLRIRGVKPDDTGQYECQVNSEPKMSLAIKLSVSVLKSEDKSKWLGYAKIKEPKEIFVQHGSPFYITCEIVPSIKSNVNSEVWWLHEDTQILLQAKESRISIETSFNKEKNTIYSVLGFDYLTWQDGGIYTCLQPSVKRDSVKLIVVEAESSEAMQRDYPIASHSTARFKALSCLSIFLVFCTKVYSNLIH